MFGEYEKIGATYDFKNGEWATGDTARPSFEGGGYFDRKITGFTRLDVGDASNATTTVDGPDCGNLTLYYEDPANGPRAKACLADTPSDPTTLYWKRYQRD